MQRSAGSGSGKPVGWRGGRWLFAFLAVALSGCGLNPWSGGSEDSGEPLVDSAADASMQTYGLLLLDQRRQERAAARAQTPAEQPKAALQVASLPPADDPGIALRVAFPDQRAELTPLARASLSDLGRQLQAQPDGPLKLLAYWSGDEEGENSKTAKLIALKRAMTIRDFLTDQGIRSPPIEFPRVVDEDRPLQVVDVVVPRS